MEKHAKERILEEKMELLMKTHEKQSECMNKQDKLMRKQNEQMQLIIQHIQSCYLVTETKSLYLWWLYNI